MIETNPPGYLDPRSSRPGLGRGTLLEDLASLVALARDAVVSEDSLTWTLVRRGSPTCESAGISSGRKARTPPGSEQEGLGVGRVLSPRASGVVRGFVCELVCCEGVNAACCSLPAGCRCMYR